jgi:pyridoxal phosphate enzyme (YggS family)
MVNITAYQRLCETVSSYGAKLVAVSKQRPLSDIQTLYDIGQRDFGENRPQELAQKHAQMTAQQPCQWHFIGHLQRNKIKYIAPVVSLIHAIDSADLLLAVNEHAQKQARCIDCLLQVHIAQEESKQGFNDHDLRHFLDSLVWQQYAHIRLVGLMGMASFTDNKQQITREFKHLRQLFEQIKQGYFAQQPTIFQELSMGMSGDYDIALNEGASIVRVGSLLFAP